MLAHLQKLLSEERAFLVTALLDDDEGTVYADYAVVAADTTGIVLDPRGQQEYALLFLTWLQIHHLELSFE